MTPAQERARQRRIDRLPTVSYSEMFTYGVCPKKHHWTYRRNIEPAAYATPKADLGAAGHYAIEEHWRCNQWDAALDRWLAKQLETPMWDEDQERFQQVVRDLTEIIPRYLDHYSSDQLTIVPSNVELEFNVKLPRFGVRLNGYWDALAIDPRGGIWIMDHKFISGGQFRQPWELEMDLQIGTYEWAARELGIKVQGTIYDQIRAEPPRPPRLLANGKSLSKADIVCDPGTYLAEILRHGFDPADYRDILDKLLAKPFFVREYITRTPAEIDNFERDMLARVKEMRRAKREVYMTPNRINCSSCPFRDLCLDTLKGRDVEAVIATSYQPRTRRSDKRPDAREEVTTSER